MYANIISQSTKFVIRDYIWQRYRAAFRGGYATPVIQQAIFGLFMPLLIIVRSRFVNIPSSFAASSFFFHNCIPSPSKLAYKTVLGRGWKTGTILEALNNLPGNTKLERLGAPDQ